MYLHKYIIYATPNKKKNVLHADIHYDDCLKICSTHKITATTTKGMYTIYNGIISTGYNSLSLCYAMTTTIILCYTTFTLYVHVHNTTKFLFLPPANTQNK